MQGIWLMRKADATTLTPGVMVHTIKNSLIA